MTRERLVLAGWAVVGVAVGVIVVVFSVVVLMPIAIYPATVIATAPFLGLLFWVAWLVTMRVRKTLTAKSVALLCGSLVPLLILAVDSIVETPHAIMFVGAL